jgi:DNA-binding LytR/AlgR family response regulator
MAKMAAANAHPLLKRAGAEFALLAVFGLFMAALGPFGTGRAPPSLRTAYWLACIIGGGVIGVGLDEAWGRRLRRFWPRLTFDSLAMTPPVTLLVWTVSWIAFRAPLVAWRYVGLLIPVLIVSAMVTALRLLVWRDPAPAPTTERASDAAAGFRHRLSARRRAARLLAVQAEDHYLRVHTDAGDELITLRFSDALAELEHIPGFRTHRSWWVAADAIEGVRWRRGRGELRLEGALKAPVSRANAAALKAAGWF